MSDDDIYQRQKSEAEADARRERDDRERAERDVFAERDRRERIEFERKEREAAALYDQRERGAWEKSKDFLFSKNAGAKAQAAPKARPAEKDEKGGAPSAGALQGPALPPGPIHGFVSLGARPKSTAALGLAIAFVAAGAIAWLLHPSWGSGTGRDPFPSAALGSSHGPDRKGDPSPSSSLPRVREFFPASPPAPFAAVPTPAPSPLPQVYRSAPSALRFEAKPAERQLFNVGPGAWLPQEDRDPGFLYAPDGPVWHRGYGSR